MAYAMVSRTCLQCGQSFERLAWRLKQRPVTYCSRKCIGLAQRTRIERRCEQCGTLFWKRLSRIKAGEDRFCRRQCFDEHRRGRPMTRRATARSGDQRQAVRRIREMVNRKILPRAKDVPCVDCGHVWIPGGHRHEYDHHLGYDTATHHETVEAVCSKCHRRRTNERMLQAAFVGGWLAGLERSLVLADKWLEWVEQDKGDDAD